MHLPGAVRCSGRHAGLDAVIKRPRISVLPVRVSFGLLSEWFRATSAQIFPVRLPDDVRFFVLVLHCTFNGLSLETPPAGAREEVASDRS